MAYQQRSCLRIPVSFKANAVTAQGGLAPVKITNISVTGFQILSTASFAKDENFILQVCLPRTQETYDLQVNVLRSRNLSKDKNGYTCLLGVHITLAPETWMPSAGAWIQAQFEFTETRKLAAGLLFAAAAIIAFKAAIAAMGLQLLGLSLSGFAGLEHFPFSFPPIFLNLLNIFLATMILFCGLQVLKPQVRNQFFFASTAAFAGMAFFGLRLLLKISLLRNFSEQGMAYIFDLVELSLGLSGAFLARWLEDRYVQFLGTMTREKLYPPSYNYLQIKREIPD